MKELPPPTLIKRNKLLGIAVGHEHGNQLCKWHGQKLQHSKTLQTENNIEVVQNLRLTITSVKSFTGTSIYRETRWWLGGSFRRGPNLEWCWTSIWPCRSCTGNWREFEISSYRYEDITTWKMTLRLVIWPSLMLLGWIETGLWTKCEAARCASHAG